MSLISDTDHYSGRACLKLVHRSSIRSRGRGRSRKRIGCGTGVCSRTFGQRVQLGEGVVVGHKIVLGLVWGCDVSRQCGARKKERGEKKKQPLRPKSGARSAEVKWDRNSQGCDWKGEKLIWQLFLLALLMFPLRTKHPQHPLRHLTTPNPLTP